MAKTYAERLDEVQAAITAVLTGAQQWQYNGRMVTRANLTELHKEEKYLMREVARDNRGGIRVRGVTPI